MKIILNSLYKNGCIIIASCFFSFCIYPSYAQEVKLEKIFNLQPVKGLEHILDPEAIFEDHLGYIWIQSLSGLYKFDGYKTIHYAYDPTQPDKIAGNWISGITEDHEGNIWFGVFGGGLQKLNPTTGKFTLYKDKFPGKESLETIQSLLFYHDKIYITTQGEFCVFSTKTETTVYYPEIKSSWTFKMNGQIWMLTISDKTLSYFDINQDKLVRYDTLGTKSNVLINPVVINQKIYIIDQLGIFYSYNNKLKKLNVLTSPNKKEFVLSMLAVDNRQIYISVEKSFEIYDISKNTFSTPVYSNSIANEDFYLNSSHKLKNGSVWFTGDKIYSSTTGDQGIETYKLKTNNEISVVWFAPLVNQWNHMYPGLGLGFLLDFENQIAERVSVRYPFLSVLDSSNIIYKSQYVRMYTDKNKDTWIAHQQRNPYKVTLYRLPSSGNTIEKIGIISKLIGVIFGITKNGDDLWIGGWRGLLKWNLLDGSETHYTSGKDVLSLSSENIRYVFKDRDDDLWISTQNGLNLKKNNQDSFIHYLSMPGDTTALSFNTTSTITQDSSGIIWIATFGGGVNSFDKKTGKFKCYTSKQGLSDGNVRNILVDDFQDIWVGTDRGLSKINPKTGKILNFDKSDGIVSSYESNSLKMADGSLLFAGDCFNRIFPDRIKVDTFVPPLFITNLKLHNKDVLINGPDSILHHNINITKAITLQYKQNVITLEYAALDMVHADKRKYAYQLVGFDLDWQYVDKKREAAYTNLPPGTYIFKVQSSIDDEQWFEIKNPLYITILPPWWRTCWAYGMYLLLISYAGWKLHQFQKSKAVKKEREKALAVELEHSKEIEKAYQDLGKAHENLKSTQSQLIQSEKMASLGELTAGIAHEIQNPLNFVNNFSELSVDLAGELEDEIKKPDLDRELITDLTKDLKSNQEKINLHGKRASDIVKGMLQHSRTSSGKKELTDINKLCDEYLRLAYHGLRAKDKTFNAEMVTQFDPNLPKIEIVPQDIGRVILNLITNAFYAVNERANLLNLERQSGDANLTDLAYGPKVTVTTQLSANSQILISVKDNGSGIPEHIKDKIFQPFFTTKPTGQGTGLGLSLAYDIVKAHGGEMKVESVEGEGSDFIIQLPIETTV
ncbi:MAG: hypothetical protein IPO98_04975 [Saprospiraceae bacterium]|nr:hypothetical protein [Saprospiraceae bacterium]